MTRSRRTLGQSSSVVQAIAAAIATAEGFFVSGSLPSRANNPGDLENGDVGSGLLNGKTIYATLQDGWNALYKQVSLMFGGSAFYNPAMTISQIAQTYTGGDNPEGWAATVAQQLGVSVSNTLNDVEALLSGGGGGGTLSNALSEVESDLTGGGGVGGMGLAAVIIGLGIAVLLF